MVNFEVKNSLSQGEIEKKAKALGMDYPSEFKVIEKDVKWW